MSRLLFRMTLKTSSIICNKHTTSRSISWRHWHVSIETLSHVSVDNNTIDISTQRLCNANKCSRILPFVLRYSSWPSSLNNHHLESLPVRLVKTQFVEEFRVMRMSSILPLTTFSLLTFYAILMGKDLLFVLLCTLCGYSLPVTLNLHFLHITNLQGGCNVSNIAVEHLVEHLRRTQITSCWLHALVPVLSLCPCSCMWWMTNNLTFACIFQTCLCSFRRALKWVVERTPLMPHSWGRFPIDSAAV